MRRLALVLVSLLALAIVASAWARDPRDEQERLRAADVRAARASLIRRADLGSGWKPDKTDDDDNFNCPGFDPDFSKFVITGKADAAFTHPAGAWLATGTEIYASKAHAVGDFRLGARPELVRCLRYVLEHDVNRPGDGVTVRVLSSRMLPSPGIGQRSIRLQVAARMTGPARSITMYVDLFAFQQDRGIGFLMTMSVEQPIRDGGTMARMMLARMR